MQHCKIPLSNLHTHSSFCDGIFHPEIYIQNALEKKGIVLGFSSHAPFPYQTQWAMEYNDIPDYFITVNTLKGYYKNRIKIMIGLETDFMPYVIQPSLFVDNTMFSPFYYHDKIDSLQNNNPATEYKLDYVIGAVHQITNLDTIKKVTQLNDTNELEDLFFTIDASPGEFQAGLDKYFKGDIKKAVISYYSLIGEMIIKYKPTVCAHFDLIKKNNTDNCFFEESEAWYHDIVYTTLKKISQTNTIIEINTGGLARKRCNDYYPSGWILKLCRELDIPITISSDAHLPDQVYALYYETVAFAKSCGINHIYIPSNESSDFIPYEIW